MYVILNLEHSLPAIYIMTSYMISPLVSVVMPVYNEQEYLSEAIASILDQTFRDFEFIVVDDGSTDDTPKILHDWQRRDSRIIVIHQENSGITNALNAGLKLARGKYIARMDGNDVSYPNRFEIQLEYLAQRGGHVAVGGAIDHIDEDGDWFNRRFQSDNHREIEGALYGASLTSGASLPHAGALIRTWAIREVGGYDEQYGAAQDRDLWLRLSQIGHLGNVPQVVIAVRILIEAGISSTKAQFQRDCSIRAIHSAYHRIGKEVPEQLHLHPVASQEAYRRRIKLAMTALSNRRFDVAQKHILRALTSHPGNYHCWSALVKILRRRWLGSTRRTSKHVATIPHRGVGQPRSSRRDEQRSRMSA